jgi:type II secretory pathway pseudopilin PulG
MRQNREHGFILVTVIAVMALLAMIGVTILVKSTSEMKQSGNSEAQARARGYAEAAQADMFWNLANPGIVIINDAFRPSINTFSLSNADARVTPIVPPANYDLVLKAIRAGFSQISNSGSNFTQTSTIIFRSLRTDQASFNSEGQVYYLDYSINGTGTFADNTRRVTTEGTMLVRLGRTSLNQFILLANDGGSGTNGTSGFFDTSSVYDGPVHVNQNWALSGKPTFLAGASVSDTYVWMNDAKNCKGFAFVKVGGAQTSPGGCTQPNTNGQGLQYGTDKIDLPKNATSQARAALGLDAKDLSNLGKGSVCQALNVTPCNKIPNGVYLPSSSGKVSGGIYIQGDANVTLSTLGNAQVYTILDENGKTTTITVDYVTKTTTYLQSPGLPVVLSGVPNGQLYVDGDINSLTGPARTGTLPSPAPATAPSVVPPALASQSQLNIASSGSVTVTGDVTYTENPNTTPTAKNVLGIISGSDSVVIGDSAPKDVYLNGAILAGSTGKGLGVKSPGQTPARGAIHMLGSLAEDTDQLRGQVDGNGTATAGYADDFKFDQRFLNGAVAPPFFPATTQFAVSTGWPIQRTWNEQ